jgi:membrane protein implicated in regulation of membrane protease activity
VNGLRTKRLAWTIVFLGITLVAIVLEVVAGIFHPAGTIPWTEYIAQYVPWPVQLAAYVVLAVWLPFHFWRADTKRKTAYREGQRDGHAAGYLDGRKADALSMARARDANQTGYMDGYADGAAGRPHRDAN